MNKIYHTVINENQIIGIGPLMRKKDETQLFLKCYFDLYLYSYKIEITTDYLTTMDSENLKLDLQEFQHMYTALKSSIQSGNWDIYEVYMKEKEKTKNPLV